jgi:hypothetical protein
MHLLEQQQQWDIERDQLKDQINNLIRFQIVNLTQIHREHSILKSEFAEGMEKLQLEYQHKLNAENDNVKTLKVELKTLKEEANKEKIEWQDKLQQIQTKHIQVGSL